MLGNKLGRVSSQNARTWECFQNFTGTPTGKKPLGRPMSRWGDNITVNLKEIGFDTRNWVNSAQNRNYWRALVDAALNLQVP